MRKLRCAIYTRKSTDEGLDQTFNSLDAQFEACSAYILSQAGEGWTPTNARYDDGGYSGGSIDRPGLQRLMAEVQAGRVDVIVVYKVDRLTRSLADFAKIVDILDRAKASFVSVTQAFNTTTSMGRLTLNVLLSFAQFEREVTGERIRDKIAASKARGMWVGGNPPLGYDVRDRALHINEAEASVVRDIYQRYLATNGVFALRDELARDAIRSKQWVSRAGKKHGGCAFTYGALFHMLSNSIYVGEIRHKDRTYPGNHTAILSRDLFDAVQAKLRTGAPDTPGTPSRGFKRPLLGKIFDSNGNPMTSAHGNKNGQRYLYYASTAKRMGRPIGELARVSAPAIEQCIVDAVAPLLAPPWRCEASTKVRVLEAIERLTVRSAKLLIDVKREAVSDGKEDPDEDLTPHRLEIPHQLARPSHRRRLVSALAHSACRVDRALVRAVVLARQWAELLSSGEVGSIQHLAEREEVCPIYAGQMLPLAFLAPDLTAAVLDGRQPSGLSLNALLKAGLPHAWNAQRALFARFA